MTTPAPSWVFADVWDQVAESQPGAPALLHGGEVTDWAEMDRAADGVAQWLMSLDLRPHDLVALCMRNRPEHLVSVYGCLKVAAVPAFTNVRSTTGELAELWSRSKVRAVVFDGRSAVYVEAARRLLPDIRGWLRVDDAAEQTDATGAGPAGGRPTLWADVASAGVGARRRTPAWGPRSGDDRIVLFTGGTTGRPKGVVWRQDDLFSILDETTRRPWAAGGRHPADALRDLPGKLRRGEARPARLVVAAPVMHGLGALTAMSALATTGAVATLVAPSYSAAEMLDTVEAVCADQATIVGDAMARPILDAVAAHPGRWSIPTLRVLLSSGSRWSAEVKKAVVEEFPHVRCVDVLGATETIGVARSVTTSASADGSETSRFELGPHAAVIDSHGVPLAPGSSSRGRVVVRGRLPLGYLDELGPDHHRPGADGWSDVGDWASVETDGSVRLHGRGSEVINTGGEKVYAEEVESAVVSSPTIVDAAVVGVEDPRLGQLVVALVELAPDATVDEAVVGAQLRDHISAHLAGYKLPRSVHVVASLERRPDGKVDRRALQRRAEDLERARVG